MIPIECPNCGRSGNVPPDRLLARLVCKACHSVFHMDAGGRMVLGEPGDPNAKNKKPQYSQRDPLAELGETWSSVPKAVKLGVPAAIVLFMAYLYWPASGPAYTDRAVAIVQGLTTNSKSKVVGLATKDTGDAAGQWFDLIRGELEKNQVPADVPITPNVWAGDPLKQQEITIFVVLSGGPSSQPTTLSLSIQMKYEGSNWYLEGAKSFTDAERSVKSASKK